MSVSRHEYAADVGGTVLSVLGGDVTLDAGVWPHVQGTIRVPADAAVLPLLDPREDARVRIVVDREPGAQHRVFDLAVRRRGVSQSSGEVTLPLASDEALLADYRPLADDLTPLTHQASLRAVVNYVLGAAIPGAELEASPAVDGDLTTYTDAENAFRDPRASSSYFGAACSIGKDATWPAAVLGVPHWSIWMHTPTGSDSYAYLLPTGSMNGMQPGETWVLSATGRVHIPQGGTVDARARRLVFFMDVGGYVIAQSPALPADGTPARVSVEVTLPQGCREIFARAYHGATAGEVKWSQFRLTKKSTQPGVNDAEYFWGGQPDTAVYDYSYAGDPDVSVSKRRAIIDRKPELLVWRAGTSAIDFLHPLVQVHGLRLVCDEQRRWTLRPADYTAPGVVNIRYGVNMIDGDDTISRDDTTWFDAAIVRYRWTDYAGVQQERVDAYAEPGATRAVEIVKNSPWPGVGFAEYAVKRALQRGREVTGTTVADWSVHAEQPIVVTLNGAPTQVGLTQAVTFTFDDDRMRVRTRTTDTPASAWVLIPAGEKWIDSPVGESWTEEII